MLNYLFLWEGVRSLHLLPDPSAVCCCCLKRSLLPVFLLEVRKTIFQSTLPVFLGTLLNLRRRLRISWSGETSLDLEKNKQERRQRGEHFAGNLFGKLETFSGCLPYSPPAAIQIFPGEGSSLPRRVCIERV